MQKIIVYAAAGLVLLFGGSSIGYNTLKNFNNDNSLLFLGLAVLLIGIGIYSFIKSKNAYYKIKEIARANEERKKIAMKQAEFKERLEKDTAVIAEWEKTAQQKDRLTILQMAASEDEPK